jgi:hypothetical protein
MEAAMSTTTTTTTTTTTRRRSVYDGRRSIATVEQHGDGSWQVFICGRPVGVCKDWKSALRLVHFTLNPTATPRKDF